MIAVYRKMVGGDAILRIGGDRQGVLGSELHGKTVGIVGLGAIGQRVALLANAFGCKILGYNRSPKALPHITQVDKDTLLRQSDIITVHLPLNPETKAFIGTNEFALMQPHAVLINTARGPIVSQEALYNALKKGQIAGAAVDVYDQEPPLPLNLELFNAPNLLMLPHMGYATREAFETRLNIVIRMLGKNPVPRYCDDHNDIVTCFDAGTADALIGFCQGIQAASPVDSYAAPEPSPEPGYTDEVVMASGSFTQGSTIELSCDGPLREPYTCYLQGGLNFAASRAGVLLAIQKAYFKD